MLVYLPRITLSTCPRLGRSTLTQEQGFGRNASLVKHAQWAYLNCVAPYPAADHGMEMSGISVTTPAPDEEAGPSPKSPAANGDLHSSPPCWQRQRPRKEARLCASSHDSLC